MRVYVLTDTQVSGLMSFNRNVCRWWEAAEINEDENHDDDDGDGDGDSDGDGQLWKLSIGLLAGSG